MTLRSMDGSVAPNSESNLLMGDETLRRLGQFKISRIMRKLILLIFCCFLFWNRATQKFKLDVKLEKALNDSSNASGSNGQVLSSTGTSTCGSTFTRQLLVLLTTMLRWNGTAWVENTTIKADGKFIRGQHAS